MLVQCSCCQRTNPPAAGLERGSPQNQAHHLLTPRHRGWHVLSHPELHGRTRDAVHGAGNSPPCVGHGPHRDRLEETALTPQPSGRAAASPTAAVTHQRHSQVTGDAREACAKTGPRGAARSGAASARSSSRTPGGCGMASPTDYGTASSRGKWQVPTAKQKPLLRHAYLSLHTFAHYIYTIFIYIYNIYIII